MVEAASEIKKDKMKIETRKVGEEEEKGVWVNMDNLAEIDEELAARLLKDQRDDEKITDMEKDIRAALIVFVDNIWKEFGDGVEAKTLTREQMRKFIIAELTYMDNIDQFNEEDFEIAFNEFDQDGSGEVDKAEMKDFIRKVACLGKETEMPDWQKELEAKEEEKER